ncbi:MAG: hypothetical protein KBA92_02715, partial [Anaerolineaceae bacterium]|nr:hypothetical protein [Anaerolineaceae bacterium]
SIVLPRLMRTPFGQALRTAYTHYAVDGYRETGENCGDLAVKNLARSGDRREQRNNMFFQGLLTMKGA